MPEARSLATRRCIVEAAQRLFATRGYHGASIRDMVHACGVSNAALYYHFGSKQGLYFHVLGEYVSAVVDRLRAADTGQGACRSRLTAVALAHARIILESQNVLQVLLRDLAQFDRQEIARLLPELSHQIPAVFAAILDQGIAAGEVRAENTHQAALLITGMINAVAVRRLYDAPLETTIEQDIDLVVHLLFEGIAVQNPAR